MEASSQDLLNLLFIVVATLVLRVTNTGFRRPEYKGRVMAVESIQQGV